MKGDGIGVPTVCLPRDVLASILLRFPASDVRRFRRVCKEWRDAISDPSFIAMHAVDGPRSPTHTIVFYRDDSRYCGAREPFNGGGFLFDEHWRLTARFTVNESVDMIGTCMGLLCFRDRLQDVIRVVEPFTGESIALPLPQMGAARTCSADQYCFGFDASTRQYKIVHSCYSSPWSTDQELSVLTVGADKGWRTLRISCELHGMSYDYQPMAYDDDGAVYWATETVRGLFKYARFDLATEEITSVEQWHVDCRTRMPMNQIRCQHPLGWWILCDIMIRWFAEGKDGCWPHNITVLPHDAKVINGSCPQSFLPKPHVLQRGHLLKRDIVGALYAHEIQSSSTRANMMKLNTGSKKKLLEIGRMEEEPVERYKFFPVRRYSSPGNEQIANDPTKLEVPIVGRLPCEGCHLSAFAYVPTLSPASFATPRP